MSHKDEPVRLVELEGCLNFRDLGGYRTQGGRRVRWGQLYRSDALHHMSVRDVQHVRDELGVRAVIDLRSSAEVTLDGMGPLATPPIDYHHIPLFDGGRGDIEPEEIPLDLGHQYFLLLGAARGAIRCVLEILADATEPALFHCAAGKDRTGLISAVVLGLLEVEETHIIEDYVFTSRNIERIIERLRQTPSYKAVFDRLPPQTLHAEPNTMASFLGRVRKAHGSLREFALGLGLASETVTLLEERLLEQA
ncbi:MAG: tyrosine-protein phosphatase [Deltaproteobacteria bacterium]|nr:tyrosine-protein phosphatase [Deltaproteobacteria bacterium]